MLDYLFVHIPDSPTSHEGLQFLQRPDNRGWDDLYIGLEMFRTMFELLGTLRLARLLYLEACKRDLEMAVGTLDKEGEWYECRGLQGARRKLVIGSIEMLIGEVIRRLRRVRRLRG